MSETYGHAFSIHVCLLTPLLIYYYHLYLPLMVHVDTTPLKKSKYPGQFKLLLVLSKFKWHCTWFVHLLVLAAVGIQ